MVLNFILHKSVCVTEWFQCCSNTVMMGGCVSKSKVEVKEEVTVQGETPGKDKNTTHNVPSHDDLYEKHARTNRTKKTTLSSTAEKDTTNGPIHTVNSTPRDGTIYTGYSKSHRLYSVYSSLPGDVSVLLNKRQRRPNTSRLDRQLTHPQTTVRPVTSLEQFKPNQSPITKDHYEVSTQGTDHNGEVLSHDKCHHEASQRAEHNGEALSHSTSHTGYDESSKDGDHADVFSRGNTEHSINNIDLLLQTSVSVSERNQLRLKVICDRYRRQKPPGYSLQKHKHIAKHRIKEQFKGYPMY